MNKKNLKQTFPTTIVPGTREMKMPGPVTMSRSTPTGSENNSDSLRVRMYRVGFGDFFLMTIPSDSGPQHILIDCGVTGGRTGKGDLGTIKDAVADMATETQKKLALIIVTHRHMDHIIGFSRCAEQFKDFEVAEIWMSIWETEYDSKISELQADLNSIALSAQNYIALAADDMPQKQDMSAMLQNATGLVLGMKGGGGGTNAASLALLKNGFGVKPKYYCKGQQVEMPKVLAGAGLSAEILGPPPTDATQFMKLMDLRKGVGQYLQAAESSRSSKIFRPFLEAWQTEASSYPESAFREWKPRGSVKPSTRGVNRALEKAVQAAQPAALMSAVKRLDDFLNNQSLVVLFTYKGKKLLFAGDAQGGNWEYWMYDDAQPTTTPSGKIGKDAAAVLSDLVFYKVGHHGSTNATPIAAVENMNSGFVAMCSTQEDCFGSVDNNSEVPRRPLLNALSAKCALVRSDQIDVKARGKVVPRSQDTDSAFHIPKAGQFKVGSCYVDYLL